MREIKFRGKHKDEGFWHYGSYVALDEGDINYICGQDELYCLVDPKTVGQFTGLHDSTKWKDLTEQEKQEWIDNGWDESEWKGKEVYGGDVLKTTDPEDDSCFTVVWQENGWRKKFTEWPDALDYNQLTVFDLKEMGYKVIGNIHNPELLK